MAKKKFALSMGKPLLLALTFILAALLSSCKTEGKNMKAELFFTPELVSLLQAIQRNDKQTAQQLLAQGADLNVRGDEGITPLLWLIMQKKVAPVELALQLGADANFPAMIAINRDGPKPAQPLAILAGDGDNKLFSVLLEYGADPNSRDNSTGKPAIFGCIGHSNWEQFNLLLKYGVDLNASDNTNNNSALYAAGISKYDFVYKLVSLGASATQRSTTGASVAWRVHSEFENNAKNPAFKISADVQKTKALLIEQGVTFPPLSPKEYRASLNKEPSR